MACHLARIARDRPRLAGHRAQACAARGWLGRSARV